MRDARQISSREVSQGVQRHVLAQATWVGSTVVGHGGAVPPVFVALHRRAPDEGQRDVIRQTVDPGSRRRVGRLEEPRSGTRRET